MGLGARFSAAAASPAQQRRMAREAQASATANDTMNIIYEMTGLAEFASRVGDTAYGRVMSLTPD